MRATPLATPRSATTPALSRIRNAALYFRAAIDTMKQLKAEKAAKAVEEEFA